MGNESEYTNCLWHMTKMAAMPICGNQRTTGPLDHWSCIVHLNAEDMLKSAVVEEKKFKHSPRVGADNPLGPKFLCQVEGLITMVICCKLKKNLFNL